MTDTATLNDDQVTALTQRVAALESSQKYEATKDAVQKVEAEFLTKLREIRKTVAGSSGSGNSKEMEALQAENAALKRTNAKLEYRVQHMLTSLEELYSKVPK